MKNSYVYYNNESTIDDSKEQIGDSRQKSKEEVRVYEYSDGP